VPPWAESAPLPPGKRSVPSTALSFTPYWLCLLSQDAAHDHYAAYAKHQEMVLFSQKYNHFFFLLLMTIIIGNWSTFGNYIWRKHYTVQQAAPVKSRTWLMAWIRSWGWEGLSHTRILTEMQLFRRSEVRDPHVLWGPVLIRSYCFEPSGKGSAVKSRAGRTQRIGSL